MPGRFRSRFHVVRRSIRRTFRGVLRRHDHNGSCPTCQAANPPLTRSPLLRPQTTSPSAKVHRALSTHKTQTGSSFILPEIKGLAVSTKIRRKPPPPLSLPFSGSVSEPSSTTSSRSRSQPPAFPAPVPFARWEDVASVPSSDPTSRLTPISEFSQLSIKQLPLKSSASAQQPRVTDLPDVVRAAQSQTACHLDSESRSTRVRRLTEIGRRHGGGTRLQVHFPAASASASSLTEPLSVGGPSTVSGMEASPFADTSSEDEVRFEPSGSSAPPDFTPFKYWSVFARIVSHSDWSTALALRQTSRVMREMVERSFPNELWMHGTDESVEVGFFEVIPNTRPSIVRRRLPFFSREEEDAKGRQAVALWRASSVEISGRSSKALNGQLRGLSHRANVLIRHLEGTRHNPLMLPRIESLIIDSFHMRSLRLHASHGARNLYIVCPSPRFRERSARRTLCLLNPSVRYLYVEIGGRRTAHAVAVLFDRLKRTKLFPRLVFEMGYRGDIIEWDRLLRGSLDSLLKSWWSEAAWQLRQLQV